MEQQALALVHRMAEMMDEAAELILTCGLSLDDAEQMVRRNMARKALQLQRGNQSKAARAMQIHRNTLVRIIGEEPTLRQEFPRRKA